MASDTINAENGKEIFIMGKKLAVVAGAGASFLRGVLFDKGRNPGIFVERIHGIWQNLPPNF